jgi:hypothetical protein
MLPTPTHFSQVLIHFKTEKKIADAIYYWIAIENSPTIIYGLFYLVEK